MTPKSLIWIGMTVGSTVGGYVPTLFGQGALSLWSVIWSFIGGAIGIWLGFKGYQYFS